MLRRFGALSPRCATTIVAASAIAGRRCIAASNRWLVSTASASKTHPLVVEDAQQTIVLPDGARIYKNLPKNALIDGLYEDARTLYELVRRGARKSTHQQMLGARVQKSDGSAPYEWISYEEAIARSKDIAFAFRELGLSAGQTTCIGVYSQNRPEWIFIEHAAYAFSNILVPLYETLGAEASTHIINQTELQIVICDTLEKARALVRQRASCPTLRILVVMQAQIDNADVSEAAAVGIELLTLGELERRGRYVSNRDGLRPPKPDDLATICFTSGTTGQPKGVMLTHANIIADITSLEYFKYAEFSSEDVTISFLPLAHMFERVVQAGIFAEGGQVGFFSGDINNLADDIKELRPTLIPVVPRVLNRIYDRVMGEVSKSMLRNAIFKWSLAAKTREMNSGIYRNDSIVDRFVFSKIRERFGGRLKLVVVGSAPIAPNVLNFIRAALGCTIVEGYGQTEAVACVSLTLANDAGHNHVGVPVPCNAIKLIDAPEFEYFASNGVGEICVRGANVFRGYWRDVEKTREVLDDDGWLRTGDIGRWTDRGCLQIIDRKSHFFKLAQGEFVVPQRVENAYLPCPLIQQIFVDGDRLHNYLIAIVVPDAEELRAWFLSEFGEEKPIAEICNDKRARAYVLEQMTLKGCEFKLSGLEQVRAIHLEPNPWTIENFLTPTLKSKRPQLRAHYKAIIEALYNGNGSTSARLNAY